MADNIQPASLKRYKMLKEKIKQVMIETLEECKAPAKDLLENIVTAELGFININHPAFNRSTEFT
jgi:hypothetical protein